jgi:hypothetical protein
VAVHDLKIVSLSINHATQSRPRIGPWGDNDLAADPELNLPDC